MEHALAELHRPMRCHVGTCRLSPKCYNPSSDLPNKYHADLVDEVSVATAISVGNLSRGEDHNEVGERGTTSGLQFTLVSGLDYREQTRASEEG